MRNLQVLDACPTPRNIRRLRQIYGEPGLCYRLLFRGLGYSQKSHAQRLSVQIMGAER